MISLLLFAEQTTEKNVEVSGWEIASVIITAVTAILSLLLTFYVYRQTQKNSKNMEKISLEMAKRDKEYKDRQLKLQQREDIKLVYALLKKCSIFAEMIYANRHITHMGLYDRFVTIYNQFWELLDISKASFLVEIDVCLMFVETDSKQSIAEFVTISKDLFGKVSKIVSNRGYFEDEKDAILSLAKEIHNNSKSILQLVAQELSLSRD